MKNKIIYLSNIIKIRIYLFSSMQRSPYNFSPNRLLSGTIIRGTLKTPNSQLVTPISIKLQRPDGCD
jgi:hypothetical protein